VTPRGPWRGSDLDPVSLVFQLPRTHWRLRAAVRLVTKCEGIAGFECDGDVVRVRVARASIDAVTAAWGEVCETFAPVERGEQYIPWDRVASDNPYA
jgi:hypothetical protein